jgi:hypothetical protein
VLRISFCLSKARHGLPRLHTLQAPQALHFALKPIVFLGHGLRARFLGHAYHTYIFLLLLWLKLPGHGLMRATWGCILSNPWKDCHGMFVKGGRDFKGRIREPRTFLLLLTLINNRSIRWQLGNLLEIMGFIISLYFFSFFDHDEMHIIFKTL